MNTVSSATPPMVCILGASLGTGNRGVSALSASLIGLIGRVLPEVQPCLLIGNRTNNAYRLRTTSGELNVPVVNFRMSPFAPLEQQLWWIVLLAILHRFVPFLRRSIERGNTWIRTLANARFVGDIRGGDSFSDIYGVRNFISGSLPAITALLVNPRFILFPQTYGPFKSSISRFVAAFIVKRAQYVMSRDRESVGVASSMTPRQVELSPDVAFTLPAIPPGESEDPFPFSSGAPVVGVNVNGLMFHGGYTRRNMFGLKLDYKEFLTRFLNLLLSGSNARVLFVPHTFAPPGSVESDPAACEQILRELDSKYPGRLHQVRTPHDQSGIKWIIGKCDFFIGGRMHACIAALSQGVPALGVAYSKKFKGVFDSVGVQDWVLDGRELNADEAATQAMAFYLKRAEMRPVLLHTIPAAQEGIYHAFERALLELSRCHPSEMTEVEKCCVAVGSVSTS